MSCPVPLAPDTAVCGNGGTCIPEENRCACVNGWSGRGDFVFGEPSCNIYLPAIQYMWVAVFVVHLIVLPFTFEHVFRVLWKTRAAKSTENLIQSFLFGTLMLFANVFCAATGLIKFMHPERTIGTDPVITTTFFIGSSSFWVGATTFIGLFVDINVKNAKIREVELRERFAKVFTAFRKYNPIIAILTVIWMSMPMWMLAASSSEAFYALALCHYVGAGTTIAISGLLMMPRVLGPLRRDIDQLVAGMDETKISNSKDMSRLRQLSSRMSRIMNEVRNQSVINIPTAIIMGCWPLLQSFSSYFLPIPWLSAGIISGVLLLAGAPADRRYCLRILRSSLFSSAAQDENLLNSGSSGHLVNALSNNKLLEKQDSALSAFQSAPA